MNAGGRPAAPSSCEPFGEATFSRKVVLPRALWHIPPSMPLSSRALRGLHLSLALGSLMAALAIRARADDPFAAGDVVGEIGLARLAEEAGDAALAAHLRDSSQRQAGLMALRASPHARAPEGLVPLLAVLACGRDPVLAPAAAQALLHMIARFSLPELSDREVLQSDLRAARDALRCGEKAPLPRADIVAVLLHVRAALDALLH